MRSLSRFNRLVCTTVVVAGGVLGIVTVAAPFIGLGLRENFVLYHWFGLSRTQAAVIALILVIAGAGPYAFAAAHLWWAGFRNRERWHWLVRCILATRAYFAFPPRYKATVFSRRDQFLLLALAVVFQTAMLLIIPLAFECDAAMYYGYAKSIFGLPGGYYTYYRPPGFPIFISITGQVFLDTFWITIVVHALIGIILPILLYRILAPVHRGIAFWSAIIYIISTTPFFAAKIMMPGQLYFLFLLSSIYYFSRYYFEKDVRYLALAPILSVCAFFTRWEAGSLVVALVAVLLLVAWPRKRHLRFLVLGFVFAFGIGAGYSLARSYVLVGDASLFGSVHNWSGRHAFWTIYWGRIGALKRWEKYFSNLFGDAPEDRVSAVEGETENWPNYVRPDNGPASRKMWEILVAVARETPERYRYLKPLLANVFDRPGRPQGDIYYEYFERFEGKPEELANNIFRNPNGIYTDYIGERLRERLGLVGSERLYKQVVYETIVRQGLLPYLAANSFENFLALLGVNLDRAFKSVTGIQAVQLPDIGGEESFLSWLARLRNFFPIMAYWGQAHYSNAYYNVGGCAESHLPQAMRKEILADHAVSFPLRERFFPFFNMLRNLVRNTVGIIFLLTVWFLPWAPRRRYVLCLSFIGLTYIFAGSVAGIGPYTRYELGVQPLLILITAGGLLGLREVICKLRARIFGARAL